MDFNHKYPNPENESVSDEKGSYFHSKVESISSQLSNW